MVMDESLKALVGQHAAELHSEITEVRRHLHRHPELSCHEAATAEYICLQLDNAGIRYNRGIAGHGVVGFIEGTYPAADCIALRADMDALPILEINETVYKSQNPGVMHACGHDVHMACLIGAAKILQAMRHRFRGTVKLFFQPSEETYPGGAITMINEGVMENPAPRLVIGQHVINTLDEGDIGMRPGPYMASTDEIFITVKGKGGHAATPSQVTDPILIASHIVVALQQIVSRNADPVTPTVLSFGRISGEGRTNIIPGEVKLEGTVRTYDETWRREIHRLVAKIASSVATGMGGDCDVRISHGYPFLDNDPALTSQLHALGKEFLGNEHVRLLEPRMTAEDFAYFAQRVPSCLFRLGIRNTAKGIDSNLHTPTFDVDESSLLTGMSVLAWFALSLLNKDADNV